MNYDFIRGYSEEDLVTGDFRHGVRYRTVLYKDDHFYSGTDDLAWCGRSLDIDVGWWIDSGWEQRLGAYWVVVSKRKGKQSICSECKNRQKEYEEGIPRAIFLDASDKYIDHTFVIIKEQLRVAERAAVV